MERYVIKNQKKLRCGVTTGSCAAAAAEAAAAQFLLGVKKSIVSLKTPKGITIDIPVYESVDIDEEGVTYMVVKDSGDDPDVTDGTGIYVTVNELDKDRCVDKCFRDTEHTNLYLDGGIGVGRVTKEGLEQGIGYAAINTVPRKMIFESVGNICELAEHFPELMITVSIPDGVELAKKTFNPRLGIEDGLSVLGTSGILEPMSEKAIVDTIETEIRQRYNQGKRKLLVTPGNYGRSYASEYLGIDIDEGVKCSNYIGETLDLAVAYGFKDMLLVGNIGKLVKLAAGIMNTHSRVADGRMEILAVHTVLCGGTGDMAARIMQCINTEEVLGLLDEWELMNKVIGSICEYINAHVKRRTGDSMTCGVMLFSEKYGYLGCTEACRDVLDIFGIKQEV